MKNNYLVINKACGIALIELLRRFRVTEIENNNVYLCF